MMSVLRQSWRPSLAALSVAVPIASWRQPSHCDTAEGTAMSILPVRFKFVSEVEKKDASMLLDKMRTDKDKPINDRLADLWIELVKCCRQNQRQKELSGTEVMDAEIPMEWMRGLEVTDAGGMGWLRPVMNWVADKEIVKYVDFDHNDEMSFKEFSVLCLLALTQIEDAGAKRVTKKEFFKCLYFLMDLDGDGTIVKEEFVTLGSLLAAVGMIDTGKMDEEIQLRLQKRNIAASTTVKGDFGASFENAFQLYDEDGDKTLDEYEWNLFASEWLSRWFDKQ